jgi:hypothetical protein
LVPTTDEQQAVQDGQSKHEHPGPEAIKACKVESTHLRVLSQAYGLGILSTAFISEKGTSWTETGAICPRREWVLCRDLFVPGDCGRAGNKMPNTIRSTHFSNEKVLLATFSYQPARL